MARTPEYTLAVIAPATNPAAKQDTKGKVGAGWVEPDGSVSIKLNPCVVLSERDGLVIRLFPNRE